MRQENEMLKTYLKKAQDDIATLMDKKRELLDTVRNLEVSFSKWKFKLNSISKFRLFLILKFQHQLMSKDRNFKNDGNR